mgnify:CR=1 FL=1
MLKLENVSYSVKDNGKTRHILKDINLEINKGEVVVVTGHNGSGKSTLMKVIMGIIPVTSGKIFFDNVDITNIKDKKRWFFFINFNSSKSKIKKCAPIRDARKTHLQLLLHKSSLLS